MVTVLVGHFFIAYVASSRLRIVPGVCRSMRALGSSVPAVVIEYYPADRRRNIYTDAVPFLYRCLIIPPTLAGMSKGLR